MRRLLFTLVLALGACGPEPGGDQPLVDLREGPPNLVILALDTFRADHVGTLGNPWISTPVLDRFAAEAVVFEDCASTSTWTLPAFASLFTGLLPSEHRTIGGRRSRLPSALVPLAERLQANGFSTRAVIAVDFLDDPFGLDRGFDQLSSYAEYPVNGGMELTLRPVRKYLQEPPRGPWFLFAHYFDAHDPYEPTGEFDRMYYDGDPTAAPEDPARAIDVIYSTENRISRDPRKRYSWLEGIADLQYPVRQYAAGVSYVDGHLDDVLTVLRETGTLEQSIVVIVADHGEHLTEHDVYFTHRLPYAECLQVPLMIRLPGARAGGDRVSAPVSLADVLPTLMELMGLPLEDTVSGRSLVPLIRGENFPTRLLFAEYGDQPANFAKSVWDAEWRYTEITLDSVKTVELFDRRSDPREERNVAAAKPDLVRFYSRALDERFGEERRLVQEKDYAPTPVELDPETVERLRALGYVDGGDR